MKLRDLRPEFSTNDAHIVFDCPTCPHPETGENLGECRIVIPVDVNGSHGHCWGWNGEYDFDKLTLTPSVWHHCKSDPHFFVRDGEIVFA